MISGINIDAVLGKFFNLLRHANFIKSQYKFPYKHDIFTLIQTNSDLNVVVKGTTRWRRRESLMTAAHEATAPVEAIGGRVGWIRK